jgi:hypothetical protein
MNIKYRKMRDETSPEGFFFYPLLQVFVRYGFNMRPVLTLVDSGATYCILPASLGEVLGIDVVAGKQHQFYGFNQQATAGFVHQITLQVQGFSHWIEIDAVFIESEIMPILGQSGFFDSYQVVFERFSHRFQINTKTDAVIRNKRGRARPR